MTSGLVFVDEYLSDAQPEIRALAAEVARLGLSGDPMFRPRLWELRQKLEEERIVRATSGVSDWPGEAMVTGFEADIARAESLHRDPLDASLLPEGRA